MSAGIVTGLATIPGDLTPAQLIARRNANKFKPKTKTEQRAEAVIDQWRLGKVRFSMSEIRRLTGCPQNNEALRVARCVCEMQPGKWTLWKTSDRVKTSRWHLSRTAN